MTSQEKALFPWQDGTYKTTGCLYDCVEITGSTGDAMGTVIHIEHGEFGVADPHIAEETGQDFYNLKITYDMGLDWVDLGEVHQDGKKIITKSMLGSGVGHMEWMSEEDAAAFEGEKDPINELSHPYKEQPQNLGKFLWITGRISNL